MLSASPKTPAADLKYAIPATTKDGWETASPSDEHIDGELIQTLLDRLADNTYKNITSVVLVKEWQTGH